MRLDVYLRASEGEEWLAGGEIDQHGTGAVDVHRLVSAHLGQRALPMWRKLSFYVDFDPESEGYRRIFGHERPQHDTSFWMQLRYPGPPEHQFTVCHPAAISTTLEKRAHERHPGMLRSAVIAGVRITADPDRGLIERD